MDIAKHSLNQGMLFPYDGGEDFWDGKAEPAPPVDWAHAAARGIIADLTDRRDIKIPFEYVDHDVRKEMVKTLADIIRAAKDDAA